MKKIISALFMALTVAMVIHFNAATVNAKTFTSSDITKEWTINKTTTQSHSGAYLSESDGYLLYKVTASEAGTYLVYTDGKYSNYTEGYLLTDELSTSSSSYFYPGHNALVLKMKKNETVYFAINISYSYCGSSYTFNVVVEPATTYNGLVLQKKENVYDSNKDGYNDSEGYYIAGNILTKATALTIPSKYNSIPIVGVAKEAFRNCNYITSVTIPDTVNTIDENAFLECVNLKKAVIKSGEIENEAFARCYNLGSVTLQEGVTAIGEEAFGYTAIQKLYIPASVTSIGEAVCSCANELTAITVSGKNEKYKSVNGVLFSKDGKKIYQYPNGSSASSYTIPEGVTEIYLYCFAGSANLKKVTFASTVTNMDYACFRECVNLKSVDLSKGLIHIPSYAFYGCSSLAGINIPASVTKIYDGAFINTSLVYAVIPASVTSIGNRVFGECDKLKSIIVKNDTMTFPTNNIINSNQSVTLYGNSGSTAQTFANNKSYISFVDLSSLDCANGKHSYYVYKYKTAPTCTSYGKGYTRCAKCGAAGSLKTVAKVSHNVMGNSCIICGKVKNIYKNLTLNKAVRATMFCANNISNAAGKYTAEYTVKKTATYKVTVSNANQNMDYIYCEVLDSSGNTEMDLVHLDVKKGETVSEVVMVPAGCKLYIKAIADYSSTKDYAFTIKLSCLHEKYTTKVVKPTYAAKGYTLHTCTVCGHTYKTNYTNKLTVAATTLKSVTAGKQRLTVKWNKKSYTGYQVQIATDAGFTKNRKTVTIKGSTNLSKVVTGLKSGTKYYVRVRTYKTYNKKNYYSTWSKAVVRTVK